MSWKNIKTFLILLFIIINAYLVFSTSGILFKKPDVTYINKNTIKDVASVVKNNYNVNISSEIVPSKISNLKAINATNIIYTEKFKNSGYEYIVNGAKFEILVKTNTYSYNEENAKSQISEILKKLDINEDTYRLKTYKADEGLICSVNQTVTNYPVFNGKIKAVCVSSKITLSGVWYTTDAKAKKDIASFTEMTDITGIIVDAASKCSKSDGSEVNITSIDYGYYVTSYDKNAVSKSSPAIPCYMVRTDEGSKYYYDATNGKPIKQED